MAKYEKKYEYISQLSIKGSFDLSLYVDDILKAIPASVRVGIKLLLDTGDYYLVGSYIYKKNFIPPQETSLGKTAIADQLIGKGGKYKPLMLDDGAIQEEELKEDIESIKPIISEPVSEDEEEEEDDDDDDIPESWKVPYIDPDDFPEEPSPEPQPDIAPIPADDQYKECPYCHEKCLGSLEEHYDDVHTPKAYADRTPIEKPKQKRNKGRNMKGIEYEITDGEKFYKFVHPGGRIEFIPKDVREREMDELEGKHVKENTDPGPEQESVQVISTQKPDTTKYDVINPMIMVLNSFEKEQFRKWMKYQYNNTEAVVEERLSKLMLSTDQEYVMNQKLDLLEWYEEDQKSRKEIENYDFFSDDKKEDTKKK